MWMIPTAQMPEQPIQGRRLCLRPLVLEDIDRLTRWEVNTQALLKGYNYAELSREDREYWYWERTHGNNRYFAIDLPDRPLVGFLGLKEIQLFRRKAMMGVVIDPGFQSQGYGSEAIQLLLDYAFGVWGFRQVDLEVDQFNSRARHVYEELGFRVIDEYGEVFENQFLDLDDPLYAPWRDCFFWEKGVLYAKLWRMRRERE